MNPEMDHKDSGLESIDTTNTLKGIAISMVLTNHYLNLNMSGDFGGFADSFIHIFFILSGYGLHHSLYRRFSKQNNILKSLLIFYYERIVRIFPLLWIALFVEKMIRGGTISPWTLIGVYGPGHYWFIPALLHCYFLSPLIYFSFRKKTAVPAAVFILIVVLLNLLIRGGHVPAKVIIILYYNIFFWKEIIFLDVAFFIIGFLVPFYIKSEDREYNPIFNEILFWIFLILILSFTIVLKILSNIDPSFEIYFRYAPLPFAALLCIYGIHISIYNSFFRFLGKMSYSLYLFHISLYLLINRIGKFHRNSIEELTYLIVVFPLFLYICTKLEKLGGWIKKIKLPYFQPMRQP